jgi:hypothetical protein
LAAGTQSLQSLLVQATQLTGLPQLPVALQVSKVVPLHRVLPGVQSTQWGGGSKHAFGHAVPSLVHMPVALQTCGWLPEQRCALGVHGAQTPCTQTGFALAQGVPSTHCPMLLHVRGVLLLQSRLFGIHAPVHMPMLQTLGHAVPLLAQCPVVSQSCGWFALHRVAPGVQSHVLDPTQMPVHTAPLATHCPVVLQLCGVPLKQRELPGAQTPLHEPLLQMNGHAVPLAQLPVLLQVCGVNPLHRVSPGLQSVHRAEMQVKAQTSLTAH